MKLYTIGCSHTHGTKSALGPNYREQNWAARLFKMLRGKDPHDYWYDSSMSGSNNKILCSNVVNDLCSDMRPDHAVIQFTYPTRFWTPHSSDGADRNHRIDQPYTFGKCHQPDGSYTYSLANDSNPKETVTNIDVDFYKQYYRGRVPQQAATVHMMTEIKLIQTFLKSINIPYTLIVWPRIFANCYNDVEKTIDRSTVLNYDHGEYFDMDKLMPTHGFHYPKHTRHFRADAHQFIAESVYKHITTGTKLVPGHKMHSSDESFIDSVY
tara:strand:- start:974 stop:1774 length:801 start_codon:yes stop_codon:yes gene_type:complete